MLKFFPLGSWQPDQPEYSSSVAMSIKNVLPRTKKSTQEGEQYISYGSFPSIIEYSTTGLVSMCKGSYTLLDTDGNGYVFAGDTTSLYLLQSGDSGFADISSGVYATPAQGTWKATAYNDTVVLTNFSNPIQSYTIGASSVFTDLSADAPKARHVKMVKEFLVAGGINHALYGNQPHWVWWSASGDIDNWPTPGSDDAIQVQSDYQSLNVDDGWVQGIVAGLGSSDAAIFQERAIIRMNYVGPDNIFAFDRAEGSRGTPSPNSIVQVGSNVFYLGEDGFYIFDGTTSRSIGTQKVDKYFFQNVNQGNYHKVSGTFDPITKNIFWIYPSTQSTSGVPDRCIVYNYAIDEWSEAFFDCELLTQSLSIGYSMADFDSSLGWTMETMPFPFSSRVWAAGRLLLAGFTTNHKIGHFSGPALAVEVETGELHNNNKRLAVLTTRPIVDGGEPSIQVLTRDNIKDEPTEHTAVAENYQGYCPQRVAGKYVRMRMSLDAGSSFDHIEGIEADILGLGDR